MEKSKSRSSSGSSNSDPTTAKKTKTKANPLFKVPKMSQQETIQILFGTNETLPERTFYEA
jgi:hypothetical protein